MAVDWGIRFAATGPISAVRSAESRTPPPDDAVRVGARTAVRDLSRALDVSAHTQAEWARRGPMAQLRDGLNTKVTTALGSGLDSGFGLRFQTDDTGRMTARFGEQGRTQLGGAMRTELAEVRDTLVERRGNLGGRSLIVALRADLRVVGDALL